MRPRNEADQLENLEAILKSIKEQTMRFDSSPVVCFPTCPLEFLGRSVRRICQS